MGLAQCLACSGCSENLCINRMNELSLFVSKLSPADAWGSLPSSWDAGDTKEHPGD